VLKLARREPKYEGTRLGRQELHAEVLEDVPGALWQRPHLDRDRRTRVPELERVVVAIDPATTSGEDPMRPGSSSPVAADGHAYVVEDLSCRVSPDAWARRAVSAYHGHRADRIVAQVNNGGDMVERVIRTVDPNVAYKAVRASRGKTVRGGQG
jgi:phage terminase large subunit-like protein